MAPFNYKNEYERYRKYYLSLEPKLQKPENRAYTAIIFSFLAISLFGWYAIRPTMQTIFTLKRQIQDRTEIDKKMEDKIAALIEAQANYEVIQPDIDLLTQALPMNAAPIEGLVQIKGLAQDNNLTISGLSVSPVALQNPPAKSKTATAAKAASFPLSISVTGPFGNVKNFLLGITELRRIFQIEGMTFAPRKASITEASGSATPAATSTLVQVDLKLKVFYLTP